ncbi:MAG TPA: biotin--[acetyl-CoA-carboxylase] ligase [Candidatus Anaerotignum merdipullorum]|nr:biotin--[acetyl-CoA-carboxylase] ligase [Candidatus Anaerotignum merdipullorum]
MYRILELLRQTDAFVSGEEIGRQLSVSRAAVWKGIRKLRQEGYEIEAVTNRGYRLISPETMYNRQELETGMKTRYMGHPIYFYAETDSTNNRIRQLAVEGAAEGTLAVAEVQTMGRGRRGKQWSSPVGSGAWFSLLLRPDIPPAEASVLTLLGGLAVCRALEDISGMQPVIKWPNDILLNGKKLVGILTEMDCEMSQVHFVVLGIGINVNTKAFPPELEEVATSLFLESGKTFSRKLVVQKTMERLEEYYDIFLAAGGFAPLLDEYRRRCVTLGREVTVLEEKSFLATALDVTPEGELLVRRSDTGEEMVIYSGEVSIRGGV